LNSEKKKEKNALAWKGDTDMERGEEISTKRGGVQIQGRHPYQPPWGGK